MNQTKLSILLFILGLTLGIFIEKTLLKNPGRSSSSLKPTPSLVQNLFSYEDIFKKNKEVVTTDPQKEDLTGDGVPEIIYLNIGEGCASCHTKYLHIFEGEKEIFSLELDDPTFAPFEKGFAIFQPIRKEDEPLCCPTSFYQTTFVWNGRNFIKE